MMEMAHVANGYQHLFGPKMSHESCSSTHDLENQLNHVSPAPCRGDKVSALVLSPNVFYEIILLEILERSNTVNW